MFLFWLVLTPLHPECHSAFVLLQPSHIHHPATKPFGPSYPENQGRPLLQSVLSLACDFSSHEVGTGTYLTAQGKLLMYYIGAKAAANHRIV